MRLQGNGSRRIPAQLAIDLRSQGLTWKAVLRTLNRVYGESWQLNSIKGAVYALEQGKRDE